MSYTALQDTPIQVDLTKAANDTGWSIDGRIATHTTCNAGYIKLTGYTLIPGATYEVSYSVLSISAGYVQMFAGTQAGVQRTTAGNYVETIVATGNSILSFFSNANCQLITFNIRNTTDDTSQTQQNTIVYNNSDNEQTRGWTEFRTIAPDVGFSIFIDMITVYHGKIWLHENGSQDRNNFYGVQYNSIIKLIGNSQPTMVKKFKSISIQANTLMVTTDNGISTSLGQVSSLIDSDFLKSVLGGTLSVYTEEGVYSAQFLNDANTDLINGDPLRGNWVIIELQMADGSIPLQLFTVGINDKISKIGVR